MHDQHGAADAGLRGDGRCSLAAIPSRMADGWLNPGMVEELHAAGVRPLSRLTTV